MATDVESGSVGVGREPVFEFRRPAWQSDANCRPEVMPPVWVELGLERPTDLFFPEGKGRLSRAWHEAVEAVCGDCPSREECYAWGLHHEDEGFWGGVPANKIQAERSRLGIRKQAPEIDPFTRLVIGTFIEPSHGTDARYRRHIARGEDPCKLCVEAHTDANHERSAERYKQMVADETPEERRVRLDAHAAINRERRHRGIGSR